MEKIYANGHIPLVVGGTGFYIQALLYDIDFEDTCEDTAYRTQLEDKTKELGNEWLLEQVRSVDPASAEAIHANNTKRLIRALEYFKLTGRPISEPERITIQFLLFCPEQRSRRVVSPH